VTRSVLIGDVLIDDITFEETVDWIWARASTGAGGTVCTPNADYVVRARRDEAFRTAIADTDLRVPDGMWIVYASRLAGRALHGTVTGRRLLPAIAERAASTQMRIALFGAGDGVAQLARERLGRRYPGLDCIAIAPPARLVIGSPEDDAAVDALRAANPSVLFVGLGAPKQEMWMARRRADLPGTVIVGVGAALDIVAGRFREAPRWMTRLGFEWAFRLAQEPRRLARRYLVDDPWILLWAARARLGHER
jgi:N-acetylglucosaminyldiphosphoundecaprenol N-acetyl-beta-D-mannosaminyltransferase